MKRLLATTTAALALAASSGTALANCWNECAVPKPLGGCAVKVKVCDVEDPGRAFASLSQDAQRGYEGLRAEWQRLWRSIPEPLQSVLEKYPITIITTIYPETRPYAVAVAAIESYYSRGKTRSQQLDTVIQQSPDWKRTIGQQGLAVLLAYEAIDVSQANYDAWQFDPVGTKYDLPWANFLSCVNAAQSPQEGERCTKTLRREVNAIGAE